MNGFYISIGKQGSGKTAFITKICNDEYTDKKKIFSNYTLFKLPFTRVVLDYLPNRTYPKGTLSILETIDKRPNYFNNSIMLIDEIHIYFDSLDFMKKNNRKMQIFFSQLRKRKILLLATTQYFMNVDIRIRRQCMNVFEMEHIHKGLFHVITHEVDGYFYQEVSNFNLLLEEYFDHYDTNEIIDN